jgi:hypothetical protein
MRTMVIKQQIKTGPHVCRKLKTLEEKDVKG